MLTVGLYRIVQSKTETMSIMVIGDHIIYTLEPPWLGNRRNVSCIPPGRYRVKFLKRSASGKYRNCYHVQNVPGRSGILIHAGNTHKRTKGCILPGKNVGWLAGKRAVLNSRSALSEMIQLLGDEFDLEIIDELAN